MRVPRITPEVPVGGPVAARQQIDAPVEAFGGGLVTRLLSGAAQNVQQLGSDVERMAAQMREQEQRAQREKDELAAREKKNQEEADQLAAHSAWNGLQTEYDDKASSDTGLYATHKGMKARDLPDVDAQLRKDIAEKWTKDLNARSRLLLDQRLGAWNVNRHEYATKWAAAELNRGNLEADQSGIKLSIQQAARAPYDAKGLAAQEAELRVAYADFWRRTGTDTKTRELQLGEALSEFHTGVALARLGRGDAKGAEDYVTEKGELIQQDARAKIGLALQKVGEAEVVERGVRGALNYPLLKREEETKASAADKVAQTVTKLKDAVAITQQHVVVAPDQPLDTKRLGEYQQALQASYDTILAGPDLAFKKSTLATLRQQLATTKALQAIQPTFQVPAKPEGPYSWEEEQRWRKAYRKALISEKNYKATPDAALAKDFAAGKAALEQVASTISDELKTYGAAVVAKVAQDFRGEMTWKPEHYGESEAWVRENVPLHYQEKVMAHLNARRVDRENAEKATEAAEIAKGRQALSQAKTMSEGLAVVNAATPGPVYDRLLQAYNTRFELDIAAYNEIVLFQAAQYVDKHQKAYTADEANNILADTVAGHKELGSQGLHPKMVQDFIQYATPVREKAKAETEITATRVAGAMRALRGAKFTGQELEKYGWRVLDYARVKRGGKASAVELDTDVKEALQEVLVKDRVFDDTMTLMEAREKKRTPVDAGKADLLRRLDDIPFPQE
jgi:hypothetical protein